MNWLRKLQQFSNYRTNKLVRTLVAQRLIQVDKQLEKNSSKKKMKRTKKSLIHLDVVVIQKIYKQVSSVEPEKIL